MRHHCTVEGCNRDVKGHGLCNAHYLRQYRHGRLSLLPHPPLEERFWARVEVGESGVCWPWTGFTHPNGYGGFGSRGDKERLTHRVAWTVTFGPIPKGQMICHTCDNRRCCNPKHLFLGTALDNYLDAYTKGRSSYGESHPISKLTDREVRAIRRLAARGSTFYALAKQFGVSDIHIARIVRRRAWRHVA